MRQQRRHAFLVHPDHVFVVLLRVVIDEHLNQLRHVVGALAQRRQRNREDVQPIKQILAQLSVAHRLLDIAVGGREHAHVERYFGSAADPPHPPFLDHAQQLGLQLDLHLGDFVEQQRAAIGDLEASFAAAIGAGKRAALVAEQLALHQILGNRGAVDRRRMRRRARGDNSWMVRATSSLPVPLSPRITTEAEE